MNLMEIKYNKDRVLRSAVRLVRMEEVIKEEVDFREDKPAPCEKPKGQSK